jgi:hypothetical protein
MQAFDRIGSSLTVYPSDPGRDIDAGLGYTLSQQSIFFVPARYLRWSCAEKLFQFPDLMKRFKLAALSVKIGTREPE